MPVHDGGGEEPAIAMGSVGGLKRDSTSLARIINRVLKVLIKLKNSGSEPESLSDHEQIQKYQQKENTVTLRHKNFSKKRSSLKRPLNIGIIQQLMVNLIRTRISKRFP
jgi:hypothetical protein